MTDQIAVTHKDAKIADGVSIGPYALIEEGVIVEPTCKVETNAILQKGAILEKNVTVDGFVAIRKLPQKDNKGCDESTPTRVLGGHWKHLPGILYWLTCVYA